MVDLTAEEKAAIRKAMERVVETLDEIGWGARLENLTEHQVLTLIEVAVGGFQDAMRATAQSADAEVPF
jgi:hypothetical protein